MKRSSRDDDVDCRALTPSASRKSLDIRATYSISCEDVLAGKTPTGPFLFSPDGKFIFIMASDLSGRERSFILDSETAEKIGEFSSGFYGFDISRDGKLMSTGNGCPVKIYSVIY